MRRPHPDAVLASAALLAVLLLAGLAEWLAPPRVTLAEAATREGARVEVEARVLAAHEGRRARFLTLSDGAHRLDAFAPLAPPLERGDVLRAVGVVARADDALALSLESVEVVLPTARVIRTPAELAARPWELDGARVVAQGEVRAGALAGGGARVRLAGDDAPAEGAAIVTGFFRYHERDASFVIRVESWTRPS